MDYNVVTGLAKDLGAFSKSFKTYISKSEQAAKRIRNAENNMSAYESMTVEDYYVQQRIEEKMSEPTYLAISDENQRAEWIRFQEFTIRTSEPFEKLSEARKSKYTQDFEALKDSVGNAKVQAMVAVEEDKIMRQKDALIEAINLVRRKNGVTINKINANITHLNAELEGLEIEFESRVSAADMSEVDAIQAEFDAKKAAVQGRIDFYNSSLGLMDTFTAELDEIEMRNSVVGDYFKVNFEESTKVFELIANGLDKLNEANIASDTEVERLTSEVDTIAAKVEDRKGKDFVFDLSKNSDGTFNIIMRKAGKMHTEKNLPAEAITEEFVSNKMNIFAGAVATETKFTRQEILDGQVVIRFNGLVIGKQDKNTLGRYTVKEAATIICTGIGALALGAPDETIEEELEEEVTVTPGAGEGEGSEGATEGEEAVEEELEEEAPVVTPVVGEGESSEGAADGEEAVEEELEEEAPVVTPGATEGEGSEGATEGEEAVEEELEEEAPVVTPVVGEGGTTEGSGEGTTEGEGTTTEEEVEEEIIEEAPEVTSEELGTAEEVHEPTKAEKMAKVIKARKTKFGKTRDMAVLAAAGLFGVSLLGAGTLPLAAIAAGVATIASAQSLMTTIKEFAGKKCAYHKLNKLAKKVGAEVEYDQDHNKARFVVVDGTDKRYIEAHDVASIKDLTGIDLQEELDKTFKNKTRGVANPRTIRELDYKDFPKVTVDGLEHAFDEFGGMMTKKEENGLLYRAFSGKKEHTGVKKVAGFFAEHNPFRHGDDEEDELEEDLEETEEETLEEAPVIEDLSETEVAEVVGVTPAPTPAPVVVEEGTPVVVAEEEDIDIPFGAGLSDDTEDELEVVAAVTPEELEEAETRTLV